MTIVPTLRRFLSAVACLPALALAAPPTVNSALGAIKSGQVLIISGANMVNEDRTNWDPFFINHPNASSFEGANPSWADQIERIRRVPRLG